MMNDHEHAPDIHLLMASQHGAAATTQVRQSLRWQQQRSMVEARIWQRDGPRVVTSRSTPTTWHQRVMVATLATRGVASHSSAARLHGLDGFHRCDEVHITLRYHQRRQNHESATVHISRVLDEADQLRIQGIPTVILPVCLIQLAECSTESMIKALEGSMRDGVSPTWIRQVATRYDRRGRSAPRQLLERVGRTSRRNLATELVPTTRLPPACRCRRRHGRRVPDLRGRTPTRPTRFGDPRALHRH
jgi:hypothetical protein